MGLLAYDRTRLDSLRSALVAALDDLHGIRSDDEAAAAAMTTVRSGCRTLNELCLPRVQDILNADPLSSYHKAKVGGNDIRQSLVYTMFSSYRWEVSSDPFDDNTLVVTPEEARALGFRLQNGKLTNDPEEIAFIARQLHLINSDPRLRAEFLANLIDLDRLAERFAADRLDLVNELLYHDVDPATSATLRSIDATFAELAQLYQARPANNHAGPYPTWVGDVEPFTAALLLRYAGLDSATLGHVANDLLVRWRHTYPSDEGRDASMWSDFDTRKGPNTADILFQLMLTTPGASTVYVIDAADNPASMWFSADDPGLAQQVALDGTDPANIDAADSGEVIRSFIEFSQSERLQDAFYEEVGYPAGYVEFLGAFVAPWLLQFSINNYDWNMSLDEKSGLLETVLQDRQALETLIESHQTIARGLVTTVQAARGTTDVAAEYAATLGMLGRQIVNQQVLNEEQRRAAWDSWWSLTSDGLAFLPVPAVVGLAIDKVVEGAQGIVADKRWLNVPRPDDVEDQGEYELDWMLTISAASFALAIYDQLGLPPDDRPPEPDETSAVPMAQYESDFHRWASNHSDPRIDTVELWKSLFVSPADAGKSQAG